MEGPNFSTKVGIWRGVEFVLGLRNHGILVDGHSKGDAWNC